jgi:tellurite resistance protein
MNLSGWHRLWIVSSIFYMLPTSIYFYNNYPNDGYLQRAIKLNHEKYKEIQRRAELEKKVIACRDLPKNDNDFNSANEHTKITSILSNPQASYEEKSEAIKNFHILTSNSDLKFKLEVSQIEGCISKLVDERLTDEDAIKEVHYLKSIYELQLPAHWNVQRNYINKSLLIIFLPIFIVYALGLIIAWIVKGFRAKQ